MTTFVFTIFRLVMNAIYALLKRVVRQRPHTYIFLSRQHNKPPKNFVRLAEEIQSRQPLATIYYSCERTMMSDTGILYIRTMLKQMLWLARAEVCVTESYCPPISILNHRPTLRVIQLWHSLVAIKKFGWQTVDTPEGSSSSLARVLRMHQGYDLVAVGSEFQRPFFAEAMNTPIERILPLGVPQADYILNIDQVERRKEMTEKYPQIEGKKVVVYAPTMRRGRSVDYEKLFEVVQDPTIQLVVKLHPLDSTEWKHHPSVIIDTTSSTMKWLASADIVVSDYSGIAAEAVLLGKPLFFYIPDLEQYDEQCGLNIDVSVEFPEVSFREASQLAEQFNQPYSIENMQRLRDKLVGACDGNSTSKIADLIVLD